MNTDVPPSTGRETEIRQLFEIVEGVHSGVGGAVVVVGEFGSGKSTVGRSVGPRAGLRTRFVRARAGEHGTDLFARLLGTGPITDDVDDVVGANAALDALADATRGGPVVLVVDDLDRADHSARRLLGILARRVASLPVFLVLIGWRRGESLPAGAAVLRLHPLSSGDTAATVRGCLEASVPDSVVDDIAAASGGNPLAAREMAAVLTPEEMAGHASLPEPAVPGPAWTARWSMLAQGLSETGRAAMLVVAVGDGLPITVLEGACARLGLGADELDVLESRRLVRVDESGRGWSRRPHRSATFHSADAESRRAVHRALADELQDTADLVLPRALHRAAVEEGTGTDAGDELESVLRTVDASPAALNGWLRAAELATEDDARVRRLVSAGLVSWVIGRPAQAEWLVTSAGVTGRDVSIAGTAAQIRGAVALSRGLPADALRILVDGAGAAARRDPRLAVDLAARVTGLAWWGGRADWAEKAANLADSIEDEAVESSGVFAALVRQAAPAGVDVMRDNFRPAIGDLTRSLRDAVNLIEPRELLFAAEIATMVGDDVGTRVFCERAIRAMRVRGRATELPFALQLQALVLAGQGRLEAARAAADEGLSLAAHAGEETDGAFQHTVLAHLAALDGDTASCERHRRAVTGRGAEHPTASLDWAAGRSAVSMARFDDAVEILVPTVLGDRRHPEVSLLATPDLVEAAVAVGKSDLAERALERFARWCDAGSSWGGAVQFRLTALAAGDSEELFDNACRATGLAQRPFESARTRLAYGEFLRGKRRRVEAREHLHTALGVFESLELPAWIDRTRSVLRASGEGRTHDIPVVDVLTPQELDIARMVSRGRSNRDVAGALHLSSRTVEYHLSKVYVKLGLDSRDQLAGALAD
ncbi:AAA family ATPase [Rhodococcus sp. BP-316]|uniref:helix-turn-helix transcriptional regulator n=1 Tax=Rhodococcus sp. BP-316 TaxID=2739445 RepID=UPI001C9AEA08|nr:AAA family ATPase [Rhodococcus sp. BP-316]MBY6683098.1 AAA family ATPase [Rhodococcus sp. BP-316]